MSAPALRDIHTLFYRGYLKSCNYHCGYCPFHKHARNDKKRDEAALWRMVDHLPLLGTPLNVMITPYGERYACVITWRRWQKLAAILMFRRSAYKLTPLFR
ncbi:inner membrane protein [Salmonella enterica subsp. enterica serovar Typhimurium str. DT104]|nr:inner membrane protein [Salmonella enterica subsp. enterica serovar Typhimurium str. DT104]